MTRLLRRLTLPAAGALLIVPLLVTDGCGEWPTLVGGGDKAFQ